MESIRVFGVDGHPMFHAGVASVMAKDPVLRWVGQATDAEQAVQLAPMAAPHVLLLDTQLPGTYALDLQRDLQHRVPSARVLVLLGSPPNANVARSALAAGAMAALTKAATAEQLLGAIHAVARGRRVVAGEVTEAMAHTAASREPGADLTERERELLRLLARGMANEDISERLAITVPTVKFHVTNILSKMHASNRTAAVLTALRHRIVHLDETQH